MITAAALIRILEDESIGLSHSWLEALATSMRAQHRLPKGGRGLHAPVLDASQCALFVAAALCSQVAFYDDRAMQPLSYAAVDTLTDMLAGHCAPMTIRVEMGNRGCLKAFEIKKDFIAALVEAMHA